MPNTRNLLRMRTSRPEQRQQIVLLNTGAPLRGQSNGNKVCFLALGHRFELRLPSTKHASHCTSLRRAREKPPAGARGRVHRRSKAAQQVLGALERMEGVGRRPVAWRQIFERSLDGFLLGDKFLAPRSSPAQCVTRPRKHPLNTRTNKTQTNHKKNTDWNPAQTK